MLRSTTVFWMALSLLVTGAKPLMVSAVQDPSGTASQKQVIQGSSGIFTTRANPVTLPMPDGEDVFQFIIYGDRTGGVPAGLKVLRQAVADTNLMDPDFVLTVGDLIQGYNRPPEWMEQMHEFRDIMAGLNMPWFPVAGNHDIYWESADPDRPRQHHESNYEKHFGPLWYSFEHKNTGFIVMYSDEGDLETGEKGFNKGRLQMVSPQQIEFLKGALEKLKNKRQVFVALHHPRWIGAGYAGSNWPVIHQMLVDAGNVPAVFAGHIHQMRYDPSDGIDYFALATTGGNLSADLPEVGFLHHFNVVTVRPEGYTMTTIPVGAVMDPKKFSQQFLTDARSVQNMRPLRVNDELEMQRNGTTQCAYSIAIPNPGRFPLEVTVSPVAADDWRVVPDHIHLVIPPGDTDGMDFVFYRGDASSENQADQWSGFQVPSFDMNVDYLHESARIRFPTVKVPIEIALADSAPGISEPELSNCLVLNAPAANAGGKQAASGFARIDSADFDLPKGPLTLEAWVYPTALNGNRAVVAKTESSEYAIFLKDGIPQFDVHLNGRYVSPKSDQAIPKRQWTHLAGVYDRQQVHLFVNGKCVQSLDATGDRTQNRLPLMIGADPNGKGQANRHFAGRIDEVRLSRIARYQQPFEPRQRHAADSETVLLLHLDRARGPFLRDDSSPASRVLRSGRASIGPREP